MQTLIIIKPDAVQRGLAGKILSRFEYKGIKINALKMMQIPKALAEEHYCEHKGKPFYDSLVNYIISSPVIVGVLEGENIVPVVRKMCGATNPQESETGTIRGDFGMQTGRNIIHASDSDESAKREIALFFKEGLCDYKRIDEAWVYE
ncbi:MAG: nucleoside-diphosphate kinase [Candidatus Altiarchaeales archaeon HGW-Altiarchaeales-3]|nr:MAG: nucleoside-diphosphate kinase [Candidatus Altiarchaeales archaeon HGW-Altiarchaeales-3]